MHPFEIIGWLGVVAAVVLISRKFLQQRNWKRTVGVVDSLGPERPGESPGQPIDVTYFPVVRFTTTTGVKMCVEARNMQFGPCVPGDKLGILYDPAYPARFCSVSPIRRYVAEAGLALVGLITVFVARG